MLNACAVLKVLGGRGRFSDKFPHLFSGTSEKLSEEHRSLSSPSGRLGPAPRPLAAVRDGHSRSVPALANQRQTNPNYNLELAGGCHRTHRQAEEVAVAQQPMAARGSRPRPFPHILNGAAAAAAGQRESLSCAPLPGSFPEGQQARTATYSFSS